MNPYLKMVEEFLLQNPHLDLHAFIKHIFYLLPKEYELSERLKHYEDDFSKNIDLFDFPTRNAIDCSVNALCAELEYAAFTDGFQKGALFLFQLLKENQSNFQHS